MAMGGGRKLQRKGKNLIFKRMLGKVLKIRIEKDHPFFLAMGKGGRKKCRSPDRTLRRQAVATPSPCSRREDPT